MSVPSRETTKAAPSVLVVHETGGQKYFEAITRLGQSNIITGPAFYEFWVARLFLSKVLKHKAPLLPALKQALRNTLFRLRVPFVRGHVIVLGMAPWDFRLAWYRLLARRNAVIYHTSWADWRIDHVPRRYGPLNRLLHRIWSSFLSHPNVSVVAVTPAVAASLKEHTGKDAMTIPHAVSDAFFEVSSDIGQKPFGLLFVGQLLPEKGIALLPEILSRAEDGAVLGIVGDGPGGQDIEKIAAVNPAIRYYGPVRDRNALADIVSRHHILLVPSLRRPNWEELFGMVIPEAMAAGLVIIASDHVGPRTILADGGGVTLSEGDTDAIARHVWRFRSDPELWRQTSRAARRAASAYSVSALAEKWRQTFIAASAQQREYPGDEASPRL